MPLRSGHETETTGSSAARGQATTSAEEMELDTKIRQWPRTPETDPYQSGLEAVAAQLHANLGDVLFAVAYNEFCARPWKSRWSASCKKERATLP